MRIWKFGLGIADRQEVEMPVGAKILSVQTQKNIPGLGESLYLWAECDEAQTKTEKREIYIFGTGNPMNSHTPSMRYIATVQMNEGILVWHIYEKPPGSRDKPQSGGDF